MTETKQPERGEQRTERQTGAEIAHRLSGTTRPAQATAIIAARVGSDGKSIAAVVMRNRTDAGKARRAMERTVAEAGRTGGEAWRITARAGITAEELLAATTGATLSILIATATTTGHETATGIATAAGLLGALAGGLWKRSGEMDRAEALARSVLRQLEKWDGRAGRWRAEEQRTGTRAIVCSAAANERR